MRTISNMSMSDRGYRYRVDSSVPITTTRPYLGSTHRHVGMTGDVAAWIWCLDCDSHARDCASLEYTRKG
jgi:hypothetical protein